MRENQFFEFGLWWLKIPRDVSGATLPLSETLTEYSFAYYLAAKKLWECIGGGDVVPTPDNLIHPMIFLVHQYLELDLKEAIGLSYSIRSLCGETVHEEPPRDHNLVSLIQSMDESLKNIGGLPSNPLSEQTRRFIADINSFGRMGEALRYPYHTLGRRAHERYPTLPDRLIVNIPAVLERTDLAWHELGGLNSWLMEYEVALYDSRTDY